MTDLIATVTGVGSTDERGNMLDPIRCRRIDLQAFLGDTQRDIFENNIRDKKRLYVPGALTKAEANALLGLERFDELATAYDVPYPDLELIENGMPASPGTTKRNRALPGILAQKLAAGATLRFRAAAEIDPRVNAVALALGDDLDAVMQVNAFLTPARSEGFVPHYDEQDIWIVQTHGSKTWSIHGPGTGVHDLELPLNRTGFDPKQHSVGAVIEEITLREGDTMYLPRGTGHSARCTDVASIHLTFAFIIVTVGDIIGEYFKAMHLTTRNLRERVRHSQLSDLKTLDAILREAGSLHDLDAAVIAGVVRKTMQDFVRASQPLSRGSLVKAINHEPTAKRYAYKPETVWRLVEDRGLQRLHVGPSSYQMGIREIAMIRSIKAAGIRTVEDLSAEYTDIDVGGVLNELEKVGIIRPVFT